MRFHLSTVFVPTGSGVVSLPPASTCFSLKGFAPTKYPLEGSQASVTDRCRGPSGMTLNMTPAVCRTSMCECVRCLHLRVTLSPSLLVSLPYLFFLGALPSQSFLHRSHPRVCFWGAQSKTRSVYVVIFFPINGHVSSLCSWIL